MPKDSRGGQGRAGGGGGLNPGDIVSTTDLISERERRQTEVDETLQVFLDIRNEYGYTIYGIDVATLKGKGRTALAYYDGGNVGINGSFFDHDKMETAYENCVKSGWHPSKGNKTAIQAVVSHELGHALTDEIAKKMGVSNLDLAANRIVEEARKATGHRGVVKMARKISEYATTKNAEAVAEAYSDFYCNGKKAHRESKAIVKIMNKYLKGND